MITFNPGLCGRSALSILLVTSIVTPAQLAAQAAASCPGYALPVGPNLLRNPDFDIVGLCGPFTWWLGPNQNLCGFNSAVRNWTAHTDNAGHPVWTTQLPSTLPIGGGARMIRIQAQGAESGIYQPLPAGLTKVIATAWVYVRSGRVVLGIQNMAIGPFAWSTKTNQWEQLRICTNGVVPVESFFVYNEDPAGGDFDIDRVELKVIQ